MNRKLKIVSVLIVSFIGALSLMPPPRQSHGGKPEADEARNQMSKARGAADLSFQAAQNAMGLPMPDECDVVATKSDYYDDISLGYGHYDDAEEHKDQADMYYQEGNFTLAEIHYLSAAIDFTAADSDYDAAKAHADACPSSCAYH